MIFLTLWLGLIIGNVLSIYLPNNMSNWDRAGDRSFFQGIALLAAWWFVK